MINSCQIKYKNLVRFVNLNTFQFSIAAFLCIFAFTNQIPVFSSRLCSGVAFKWLSMEFYAVLSFDHISNGFLSVLVVLRFFFFFKCHFLVNKTDCEVHLVVFVYMQDSVLLGRKCDFFPK